MTAQFILYNITLLFVVLHFFDSAKEQEWSEPIYRNSYPLWLISSAILVALVLVGIVPVYLGNMAGDVFSYILALGSLSAAGYHLPTQKWNGSKVCKNTLSYALMGILSLLALVLLIVTIVK